MSKTLEAIRQLVATGDVRVSEHGYDELSEDNITVRDVLSGIRNAVLVEDYPSYPKGPFVLVLQFDSSNQPVRMGNPEGFQIACGPCNGVSPRSGAGERKLH